MKYKLFGNSGLRVSELCLGTMTFGEEWGYGADKKESQKMFDLFIDRGGNFIDTANRYTEGTSENYLGEFVKSSGKRNELVLATKYGLYTEPGKINDSGNHRKNLVQSVEGSLKRLKTDYIDLLYLHMWDFTTGEEEVMRSLDDLISSGKVLYIAISDTPAWVVSRCNTLAELKGWTSFCGLQLEYSIARRDAERDLLPMAEHMDLGVTTWAALANGVLTGKYLEDQNNENEQKRLSPKKGSRLTERNNRIAKEVVEIAEKLNCSPAQLSFNWLRKKHPQIFPLVGARKASQLEDNLDCLNHELPDEDFEKINEISKIDLGFPHEFLNKKGVQKNIFGGMADQIENHRKIKLK